MDRPLRGRCQIAVSPPSLSRSTGARSTGAPFVTRSSFLECKRIVVKREIDLISPPHLLVEVLEAQLALSLADFFLAAKSRRSLGIAQTAQLGFLLSHPANVAPFFGSLATFFPPSPIQERVLESSSLPRILALAREPV